MVTAIVVSPVAAQGMRAKPNDRKESTNLVEAKPGVVAELTTLLETAVEKGRTTPGLSQKNDVQVVIWKTEGPVKANVKARLPE